MIAFSTSLLASLSTCKTVAAAVQCATKALRASNVTEPVASAEHLAVAAFSGVKRATVRHSKQEITENELGKYRSLVERRATHREPIQYLVGDWDFHNIVLKVRPPVLIPRPETEELVELVLNDKSLNHQQAVRVLDVGCGSGAILLALLNARPNWKGVGIDLSTDAVQLSAENANWLGLHDRAHFVNRDVNAYVAGLGERVRFDVVVSNPPYIPLKQMNTLQPEARLHEDDRALCGGVDGLDVVTDVINASSLLLEPGGNLWLEVDESHPDVLTHSGVMKYAAKYNDLSGNPRFCRFNKSRLNEQS